LSSVIKHLFHNILSTGHYPATWKPAVVTPNPKVNQPTAHEDLRPISVSPILFLFHKFIFPALLKPLFHGQFAFRPSGGSTAALSYVLHHITRFLEDNMNVRCIFIDYSHAFDCINHEILVRK
jgi:hypothetical protein